MNSITYRNFFHKTAVKIGVLIIYLISVNLISGYIAVWLRFPSLWGNSQIFIDYAMPLGLTWALSHWPSMILISIPLLRLAHWNAKLINRFRIICLSLFLVLIYGVIEKIPFALFPCVDLIVAFFLSLVIVPPSYKENPKLTISLIIFLCTLLIATSYLLYSKWQHRVPDIKETNLMAGLFRLNQIDVNNHYRELTFNIELTKKIENDDACVVATKMAASLFERYPFDTDYKKIIEVTYNPVQVEKVTTPYPLGILEQFEEDGEKQIACYLKYK